jgi:hypothetical protein
MTKRKLPDWMLEPRPTPQPLHPWLEKEHDNAVLAADILEREEAEATSFKDWGLYNFIEQQYEDEEEFNLSDSDVAGNMTTDETLELIRMAGLYSGGTEEYPHKRNRGLLLQDLQTAIRRFDESIVIDPSASRDRL